MTHRFELVDGDNSDIYKTYILNKTLEEIVSEAEPGQHGEPCPDKTSVVYKEIFREF